MKKIRNKVKLSDLYLRDNKLVNCSKIVDRLTVDEARVLLYIKYKLNNNLSRYILHDQEDVHGLLLAKLLENQVSPDYNLDVLMVRKASSTIPSIYFEWVVNDLRKAIYVGELIIKSVIPIPSSSKNNYLEFIRLMLKFNFPNPNDDNSPIQEIDPNHALDIKEVQRQFLGLREHYYQTKVRQVSVKWIDENNGDQINWLYNYLIEADKMCLRDVFIPSNSAEQYVQILASLDILPVTPNTVEFNVLPLKDGKVRLAKSIRGYYIKTMKNAWYAKVFHKDKAVEKSKRQITTTQDNFTRLNALAKRYDKSPNKIINELIANEYNELEWDVDIED